MRFVCRLKMSYWNVWVRGKTDQVEASPVQYLYWAQIQNLSTSVVELTTGADFTQKIIRINVRCIFRIIGLCGIFGRIKYCNVLCRLSISMKPYTVCLGRETGGIIKVQEVAVSFEISQRQPAILNIYQVRITVKIAQRFRRVPAENTIDIPYIGVIYPDIRICLIINCESIKGLPVLAPEYGSYIAVKWCFSVSYVLPAQFKFSACYA